MATVNTRRQILVASAALAGGAGAAFIASCGGSDTSKPPTETVSPPQMHDDAGVVSALLDMEDSSVAAYGYIAPHLSGQARSFAKQFEAQERAHAAALRSALVGLGMPPDDAKPAVEYRASFPPLRDRGEALGFALDVEQTAIGAYGEAFGKLFTDSLRATLAAILATEAEQAAVWLGLLGRPQVPDPFVTGPPPSLKDQ